MTWGKPGTTGPLTVSWSCTASDGTSVTASLSFDAVSGVPSGLLVENTSNRSTAIILTVNGTATPVNIAPGTMTYSPAQLAAQGLTNVQTQLTAVTLTSP